MDGGLVHWQPVDASYVEYQVEDGLANNGFRAIARTPDGTLWLGTDNGVYKYLRVEQD